MEMTRLLNDVTDDKIEFVTTGIDRPATPTNGRRVVVTGPPEVTQLFSLGEERVLEGLINLLSAPARAWAAEVALASLTRHEEDIVNAFASQPEQWRNSVGKDAHRRWREWLESRRGRLIWDSSQHVFVEK